MKKFIISVLLSATGAGSMIAMDNQSGESDQFSSNAEIYIALLNIDRDDASYERFERKLANTMVRNFAQIRLDDCSPVGSSIRGRVKERLEKLAVPYDDTAPVVKDRLLRLIGIFDVFDSGDVENLIAHFQGLYGIVPEPLEQSRADQSNSSSHELTSQNDQQSNGDPFSGETRRYDEDDQRPEAGSIDDKEQITRVHSQDGDDGHLGGEADTGKGSGTKDSSPMQGQGANGGSPERSFWWSGLFTTKNVVIASIIAAAIGALLWNHRHTEQKEEGRMST